MAYRLVPSSGDSGDTASHESAASDANEAAVGNLPVFSPKAADATRRKALVTPFKDLPYEERTAFTETLDPAVLQQYIDMVGTDLAQRLIISIKLSA